MWALNVAAIRTQGVDFKSIAHASRLIFIESIITLRLRWSDNSISRRVLLPDPEEALAITIAERFVRCAAGSVV